MNLFGAVEMINLFYLTTKPLGTMGKEPEDKLQKQRSLEASARSDSHSLLRLD